MTGASTPPRISIVIAAFDGAPSAAELLKSIDAAHAATNIPWEVVIVDNNSRDDTLEVLRAHAAKSAASITVLTERRQGVSAARNTGLRAARGEILAIIDQDCVLARDWVAAVAREFDADPDLAMLGGRLELFNPEDLPISLRVSRERTEVSLDRFNWSAIPGCNMAFRRTLMERIGPFDMQLGVGTPGAASEDIDLIYRAVKAGLRAVYSPDVVVYHNHGRRTAAQYRRTQLLYATGKGVFFAKYAFRLHRPILKAVYWEILALLRGRRAPIPPDAMSLSSGPILARLLRGVWIQLGNEARRLLRVS